MPYSKLEIHRIAVIEDHSDARHSLKQLVESMNCKVDDFESAEDFLQFGEISSVDCIVADLRLGGVSGLQLAKELRSLNYSIPFILISAFAKAKTVYEARQAGVFKVVDKPCVDQEIWEVIVDSIKMHSETSGNKELCDEIERGYAALTSQEVITLKSLMGGKNLKEIAFEESVSVRAIQLRRKNILEKLGATNLAHACQKLQSINKLSKLQSDPLLK